MIIQGIFISGNGERVTCSTGNSLTMLVRKQLNILKIGGENEKVS